jgi:WD40 repeat protein
VAWSPDGSRLASGSEESEALLVWDAVTGQVLRRSPVEGLLIQVAWSPDGRSLACSPGAGNGVWWTEDAATGQRSREFIGHTTYTLAVCWSPDGRQLASASRSGEAEMKLWDARTGTCLRTLEGGRGRTVWCVAWSPDGRRLASGDSDGVARVWDTQTGACLARYDCHQKQIHAVSWSPDSRVLATASSDRTVRLWTAETGAELARLHGHGSFVWSAAFAPGGGMLASASFDGTVRLWDVSDLAPPRRTAAPGGELAGRRRPSPGLRTGDFWRREARPASSAFGTLPPALACASFAIAASPSWPCVGRPTVADFWQARATARL